jgi:diguanylate cyclase (GGDEF)-like protein
MNLKLKSDTNNVVNAVKHNIRYLNGIVLLIVCTLVLVNARFLSSILNYIPQNSIIFMLLIVLALIVGNLYLVRKISGTVLNKLEEYSNKIDILLISQENEIFERKSTEEKLIKVRQDLEKRVNDRTSELSKTVKNLEEQINKRRMTEKELEHQAFYDQLTKMPNRLLFSKILKQVIERSKNSKNYLFAVLFIDLDRFKVINDSLGHIIGDELLIAASERMESCLRPDDTTARFGGDEFAILLDNISKVGEATRIADRIQKKLKKPFELKGYEVFVSASIGIAFSATGYSREEDILRDADSAMYRAKALGRSRYEIFDTVMHSNAMKLMKLEADLRRAVKNKEFVVHYQPIVSLKNKKITGAEALIRWEHPEQGMIPPMEFIPLAEETGLITPIGEWVLREACMQINEWNNAGHKLLRMKVNFSVRQFHNQDVLKLIKKIAIETGVLYRLIDIEITESIATDNKCIVILHELRKLGMQISIDDFGTGYSSLGSLNRLPVNTIKIDKSFVKDIPDDSGAEGIVKTIIAMAHNLGMKVLAEGVETEEQRAFLEAHNCDEIQGYLFSPPVTAEDFNQLLIVKQENKLTRFN